MSDTLTTPKIPQSESERRQDYILMPRDRYSEALEHAYYEILRAKNKHGHKDYNSQHEGYAILKEEVEEAWDEIKADSEDLARKEMIQVAAVAARFIAEV